MNSDRYADYDWRQTVLNRTPTAITEANADLARRQKMREKARRAYMRRRSLFGRLLSLFGL